MFKVMNLMTGEVMEFDDHTAREYALCYAAATLEEDEGYVCDFFKMTGFELELLFRFLPFVEGHKTLALGDFCCLKPKEEWE